MIILKDAFSKVLVTTHISVVNYGQSQEDGRTASIVSQPPSIKKAQSSSVTQKTVFLKDKLNELETVCETLSRQTSSLQSYFDARCSENIQQNDIPENLFVKEQVSIDDFVDIQLERSISSASIHSSFLIGASGHSRDIDFRGEAVAFKVTTAYMIQILSHCIELMLKNEEEWKGRLENEEQKYLKLIKYLCQKDGKADFLEGTYVIPKDEPVPHVKTMKLSSYTETLNSKKHRMSDKIDSIVMKNVQKVTENKNEETLGWYKIYEYGNLHIYRQDYELNGVVCDPLKAHHTIMGFSAHEICYYFFHDNADANINESVADEKELEQLSESTVIRHKIFKRIWPSSQRDACFTSHMRQLDEAVFNPIGNEVGYPWVVTNFSTDHEDAKNTKYVRMLFNITLICQTFTTRQSNHEDFTRKNIGCRLIHLSEVNPGGSPPSTIVRQVVKREYPKFLSKFFNFVETTTKDKPLMM